MISELESINRDINFEEFLDAITSKLGNIFFIKGDKETKEGINKIFDLFDDDNSDAINLRNLQRVANDLGETMKIEEL